MITRKSLADEIDLLDADIKVLNESKKDCFDAYRDQMIGAGISKPNIKAEIDAVKAAIKRRREALKDEHALIEKDELIDDVFHEITRAPRTRVENKEEFNAETGEITIIDRDDEDGNHLTVTVDARVAAILAKNTHSGAISPPEAAANSSSHGAANEEAGPHSSLLANQPETAAPEFHTKTEEEAEAKGAATVDAGSSTKEGPDHQQASAVGTTDGGRQGAREQADSSPVPAFIAKTYRLRPDCRNRDNCASGTTDHCYSCRVAMRERERADA